MGIFLTPHPTENPMHSHEAGVDGVGLRGRDPAGYAKVRKIGTRSLILIGTR
jgi:hypothetical protein